MKAMKNGATAVIFDISEVPQAIKQVNFKTYQRYKKEKKISLV